MPAIRIPMLSVLKPRLTECVRPRSYYRGAPGYLCGFIGKLICPVDITVAGAPSDFDGVLHCH